MPVQIGTSAIFGIGLQTGYGVPQATDGNFRYYAFTGEGYAPQQPVSQLPPESGQSIMTRGAYKGGFWGAGPLNMIPRLEANIGELLLALLGFDTYTADTGLAGAAVGCSLHEFSFNTLEEDLPYFTVRRKLPHTVAANSLGEVVPDNRIATAEFSLPAVGPMTAGFEMFGRTPTFDDNPSWPAPTYDDDDAFALMVDPASLVNIEGTTLPATAVSLSLNNNLIPPDQMRVCGSYAPKDYPCTGRAASVRVTAFCESYDLYAKIFTGVGLGASMPWTSQVFKGDVDLRAFSPKTFGTTYQYGIQFRNGALGTENNVAWSLQNANVQPGQPIMLTLLGTLQRRAGGVPFQMRLQNAVTTAYAIPA